MADEKNPLAWSEDQVRILILHQLAMMDALENLLIEKGILSDGELAARAMADQHRPGKLLALIEAVNASGLLSKKLSP